MTQPVPTTTTTVTEIKVPEPNYPMLVHVVSNPIFPAEPGKTAEPIHWTISRPHPFIPKFNVLRMFAKDDIEIFSVSEDGKVGTLDVVPRSDVRLTQLSMPLDVFIEMLEEAEAEDDDPDDPNAPGPEPAPAPAPVANGQPLS